MEKPKDTNTSDTHTDDSSTGTNPIAKAMSVTVFIPETLEIKVVDASTLNDYEVWFLISSILASGLIAFLVSYLENNTNTSLIWMICILSIIFIISLIMAISKRWTIRKKTQRLEMKLTEIREE